MRNNAKQLIWKLFLSVTSRYDPFEDYLVMEKRGFWNSVKKDKIEITQELLQGFQKSESKIVMMRLESGMSGYLLYFCNVSNEEELKCRVEDFLGGSRVNKIFNEKRSELISLPQKRRKEYITSFGYDNKILRQYLFINQYDKMLPPSGILAFDISNCVRMCRFGLHLGYINEKELMEYLHKAAVLARKHYTGFEEYGLSATAGLLFYSLVTNTQYTYDYIGSLKKLMMQPYSYFKNLDWNMDLGS